MFFNKTISIFSLSFEDTNLKESIMSLDEKLIFESLYSKYNKLLLSKRECGQELSKSTATLDRERRLSLGVQYIKSGQGNILYPLTEIARFIISQQIKTL